MADLNELQLASIQVESWDLDTLLDYAVGSLSDWYRDNPNSFKDALLEYKSTESENTNE